MFARRQLLRFAWLSIATAILTIGLKIAAYLITGSVGLLSDALESGINLVSALIALIVLVIAAQPPDDEHMYGHSKAEYFAGGAEGSLIVVAAVTILVSAGRRLLFPEPLSQLGAGLAISLLAALFNGLAALILLQAGRQHDSLTLVANGRHLMADVWTSVGVVIGVGLVAVTGRIWLDPLIALLVAANILRAGVRLVRESLSGLMDASLPAEELDSIRQVLERYRQPEIQYHALRTRRSGRQRFVSVHIQVPGAWTVQRGHTLLEALEKELRLALPGVSVMTHLEPVEDPVSWADIPLDR